MAYLNALRTSGPRTGCRCSARFRDSRCEHRARASVRVRLVSNRTVCSCTSHACRSSASSRRWAMPRPRAAGATHMRLISPMTFSAPHPTRIFVDTREQEYAGRRYQFVRIGRRTATQANSLQQRQIDTRQVLAVSIQIRRTMCCYDVGLCTRSQLPCSQLQFPSRMPVRNQTGKMAL